MKSIRKLPSDVPLDTQRWMLEATAPSRTEDLPHVIAEYGQRIMHLVYERWADGYTHYGSTMYGWSEEERLQNVLEEVADAIVYLTSGPLPACPCGTMGEIEEIRRSELGGGYGSKADNGDQTQGP